MEYFTFKISNKQLKDNTFKRETQTNYWRYKMAEGEGFEPSLGNIP